MPAPRPVRSGFYVAAPAGELTDRLAVAVSSIATAADNGMPLARMRRPFARCPRRRGPPPLAAARRAATRPPRWHDVAVRRMPAHQLHQAHQVLQAPYWSR